MNLQDILNYAAVIQAAQATARVARVVGDDIVYGTSRRITGHDPRIQDGNLEATTDQGWEVSWALADLVEEVGTTFIVNPSE